MEGKEWMERRTGERQGKARDVEAVERGNGSRRKSRNERNISVEVMFCLEAL